MIAEGIVMLGKTCNFSQKGCQNLRNYRGNLGMETKSTVHKKRKNSRPTIGYFASSIYDGVGMALWSGIADAARGQDVNLICPAQLRSFSVSEHTVEVRLDQNNGERRINGRLLVAADGGDSLVRRFLSIPLKEKSYGQTAIIANLSSERAHQSVAYERFTDSGPLALLPMTENRLSMVWTAIRSKLTAD